MDLIERQKAIDEINERQRKLIYCFGFENDAVKIMDIAKSIISAIPSAQPEIIRCKDCKYGEQDEDKWWYCGDLGCQIGDEDGNGFCAEAERRTDE